MPLRHGSTPIAGVSLRPLRIVRNPRGEVREFLRNDDGDFPGFGQVHVVMTLPGVIRAWFQHRHQVDPPWVRNPLLALNLRGSLAAEPGCGRPGDRPQYRRAAVPASDG